MNEKNFYKLIDLLPDIIYKLDEDGNFKYINENITKLGYEPEELLGKHFSTIIHPEDIDNIQNGLFLDPEEESSVTKNPSAKSAREGTCNEKVTRNFNLRLIPKSYRKPDSALKKNTYYGEVFATGIYDMKEIDRGTRFSGTMGIIRDITRQIRSENAVVHSETHYRNLIENSSELITIISADGTILFLSPSALRILGYDPYDLIGNNFFDYIHNDDRENITYRLFNNLNRKNSVIKFECRFLNSKNRWIVLEVQGKKIVNNEDELMCFVFNSRDITALKIAEDQLKKERKNSKKSEKLINAMLANISHDVRTPMQSILGYSELLMDSDLSDIQKKYLQYIISSGNSLLTFINSIIYLSKIESDCIETRVLPFSIELLLNRVKERAEKLLSQKTGDVVLRISIADNIERNILGDAEKIEMVLNILMENAVKYTEKGFIEFGVYLDTDNMAEFYVRDTGIGIAEEYYEEIYEPFKKLNFNLTSDNRGMGLGLTISKKLVALMEGELKLHSNTDESHGSTFYFKVPYKPVHSSDAVDEKSIIDEIRWSSDKILLVDDNIINRKLTKIILEKMGYAVEAAGDGREAISKFKSDKSIGLILMDIDMPVLDGYGATKLIRKIERNYGRDKSIPIIALSAYSMKDEIDLCLSGGCNEFIVKPVTGNELKRVIGKYMAPRISSGKDPDRLPYNINSV